MTGDINSATIGIQNSTGDHGITICVNSNLIHNQFSIKVFPINCNYFNKDLNNILGRID